MQLIWFWFTCRGMSTHRTVNTPVSPQTVLLIWLSINFFPMICYFYWQYFCTSLLFMTNLVSETFRLLCHSCQCINIFHCDYQYYPCDHLNFFQINMILTRKFVFVNEIKYFPKRNNIHFVKLFLSENIRLCQMNAVFRKISVCLQVCYSSFWKNRDL